MILTLDSQPNLTILQSRFQASILTMPSVYLLDYVAGNVRSLVNAIEKLGYNVEWIRSPEDIVKADVSITFIPLGLLMRVNQAFI